MEHLGGFVPGTAEFLHWVPLRVVAVHLVIGMYGDVAGDGEGDAVQELSWIHLPLSMVVGGGVERFQRVERLSGPPRFYP